VYKKYGDVSKARRIVYRASKVAKRNMALRGLFSSAQAEEDRLWRSKTSV
jgi:hypothetical protein